MITGDKVLSPNKEQELIACNDSNNINGENIKVILISSAGSEGLDFKYIRQIHILEPWYNINRIEQIIGRGVRTCSHKDLPLSQRNVQIFMYASLLSNPTIETVDLLIYRKAEEKAKLIGNITRILKEISIDCHLNYDLNLFNEDKLSKLLNNEIDLKLSNNNIIKYKIGDKPYTSLCDYMESCEYKCYPLKDNNDIDDNNNEENTLKTYNEYYLETTNNKIINIIKDLYKENYYYNIDELISLINLREKFSSLAINNALNELINNEYQIVKDAYNRDGRIINIDKLYIYQPLELNYNNSSIYERTNDFDGIIDSITYKIPDKIITTNKKNKSLKKSTPSEKSSSSQNSSSSEKSNSSPKNTSLKNNSIKKYTSPKINLEKSFTNGKKILDNIFNNYYKKIISGELNFIKNNDNSKYNYLAYIIKCNYKNSDTGNIFIHENDIFNNNYVLSLDIC